MVGEAEATVGDLDVIPNATPKRPPSRRFKVKGTSSGEPSGFIIRIDDFT
jgi:hypothetical protein